MLLALSGCGKHDSSPPEELHPAKVSIVSVEPRLLEMTAQLPGRVQAYRLAEVRARVSGIVKKRLFTEGMDVKQGQVLFEIDPASFQASLDRANADVQRAEAAAAEAKSKLDRYTPLARIEAVSQQDLVTAQTAYKTALANVASTRADAKSSRLSLEYATVRAPIAGRIGRSLVTEGALVGQGEATAMATIQQIDQVYVDLTQPVADAMRLREALASGDLKSGDGKIVATVEGTQKQREGKLLFSDISVEPTSGQVSLRGLFPNQDTLLLPGMYVRVAVPKGTAPEALLVPQRAVRVHPNGRTDVLVVNHQNVIEAREVRTGQMYGANWHILQGLKAGEQVVVGGAQVDAGQKVDVIAVANMKK